MEIDIVNMIIPNFDNITAEELYELGVKNFSSRSRDEKKFGYACFCQSYLRKNAKASYKLFELYRDGDYLDENLSEAYFYLEESATLGYVVAQEKMARYFLCRENEKDDVIASYWLMKAMNQRSNVAMLLYAFLCFERKNYIESEKYMHVLEMKGFSNANIFLHKIYSLDKDVGSSIKAQYYYDKTAASELSFANNFVDITNHLEWLNEIAKNKKNLNVFLGQIYEMIDDHENVVRSYLQCVDFDDKNIMVKLCRSLEHCSISEELKREFTLKLSISENVESCRVKCDYGFIFYLAGLFFYNRKKYAQAYAKLSFCIEHHRNRYSLRLMVKLLNDDVLEISKEDRIAQTRSCKRMMRKWY